MDLFGLHSSSPPDLNLGIQSKLSACPLSKYNSSHLQLSETLRVSKAESSKSCWGESEGDKGNRPRAAAGRKDICKNATMTSSFEGGENRALSAERQEQNHV